MTTRFPLPAWRGQQVRAVEWLKALGDHRLICVCSRPETADSAQNPGLGQVRFVTYEDSKLGRVGAALTGSGLGPMPLQEGMYATRAAKAAVLEAIRAEPPDLVIIQMVRCAWAAELIKLEAPGTPILFDGIDAMGLHFSRAADTFNPVLRPFVRLEAARCRRREQFLASLATLTVAVAERDVEALGVPEGRGRAIPVSGKTTGSAGNPASAPTVLLSGNLGYRPTVEAARWFGAEVWPDVRSAVPDARWVLAGARPAGAVRALADVPGVEIHSDVPDLGPFLTESWVAIAPMASGSGVPMKVLEAWSAGVPVVAHPWTAAGLDAAGRGAIRQAESADEWVGALVELLGDRETRETLAEGGRAAWERCYRPERVAEQIREAVDTARGV
ncbi:MAG: glycosyltransferase [Acidobacteria bacterium]|nr:glycosyltransferase [Acidobacteriota bacterium]